MGKKYFYSNLKTTVGKLFELVSSQDGTPGFSPSVSNVNQLHIGFGNRLEALRNLNKSLKYTALLA
jgi:hypothetical protein